MALEIEEKDFEIGGRKMHYAKAGSGSVPLVLLHGGSARWQSFERVIPHLVDEYTVYALDLRGHGDSDWVPGQYRLVDFTGDVVQFLKEVVKEPTLMFGHSLGGVVSLMVAAQYPEGVRAVAVGDAPLAGDVLAVAWRNSLEFLKGWRDISGGQKTISELTEILKVPFLAECLYRHDPSCLDGFMNQPEAVVAGYEMENIFPAIQCPVLLMQADPEAGGAMTDEEVKRALPLLKKGTHVKLQGLSHVFHNERQDLVLSTIKSFLDPLTLI